ncbi:MAG: response regulator [Rhodospirillaceae bacterium]
MTDSATDTPLSRLFVLVIEDEPFTRTVVTKLVETLGCARVQAAESAVAGLAILRQGLVNASVDVVVCDIDMKPVNGLDLLRALRTSDSERERRLPLIFLTGRAAPEDVAAADTLGHTAFLLKPPQPDALRKALLRHAAAA